MTRLIVISAPSGTGKTTLSQRLLADFPELALSTSSTTRDPRGDEKHGVDYYFLGREEFEAKIRAGRFAEHAEVHGNYYGTAKDVIEKALASGKPVLFVIDVQGAESLRKAYPAECFTVFVAPPSLGELERRLRERGTDSEETIRKRLRNAESEMREAPKFHHVVVNDDLERTYGELRGLVGRAIRGAGASGAGGRAGSGPPGGRRRKGATHG